MAVQLVDMSGIDDASQTTFNVVAAGSTSSSQDAPVSDQKLTQALVMMLRAMLASVNTMIQNQGQNFLNQSEMSATQAGLTQVNLEKLTTAMAEQAELEAKAAAAAEANKILSYVMIGFSALLTGLTGGLGAFMIVGALSTYAALGGFSTDGSGCLGKAGIGQYMNTGSDIGNFFVKMAVIAVIAIAAGSAASETADTTVGENVAEEDAAAMPAAKQSVAYSATAAAVSMQMMMTNGMVTDLADAVAGFTHAGADKKSQIEMYFNIFITVIAAVLIMKGAGPSVADLEAAGPLSQRMETLRKLTQALNSLAMAGQGITSIFRGKTLMDEGDVLNELGHLTGEMTVLQGLFEMNQQLNKSSESLMQGYSKDMQTITKEAPNLLIGQMEMTRVLTQNA